MSTERVFLGLGSNLGDRLENVSQALQRIAELPRTTLVQCSSVYESSPVGFSDQPSFLNAAAEVTTELTPKQLLQHTQDIEQDLGRVRRQRWGPRSIDIDILYWGNRVIDDDSLRVPHPEATRRRFVLVPLAEIAPDFAAPPDYKNIQTLLKEFRDGQQVALYRPRGSHVLT